MLAVAKKFHDFFDRVPIARSDGHTEKLLDFAEITDRFHLPAVHTKNESAIDRNNRQQPVVGRGETKGKRR